MSRATGGGGPVRRESVLLVRGMRATLSGHDLAAAAGTLTYFAAIAVVPWLLLVLWTTTWWYGDDGAQQRWSALRVLVPPDMGARAPYDALVHAGTQLSLLGAVIALFPASFYGEGIRRAVLVLRPRPDHFTGWRARLTAVPLALVIPLIGWVWLMAGKALVPLSPEGGGTGLGDRLLRILLGFVVVWLTLSGPLAWLLRVVAYGKPRWWVAAVGGLATGSCLAGFLHGFQLFLSLAIDVGAPFGGLTAVGAVTAVALWLFVLHTMLLLGWAFTTALEARLVEAGR